MAAVNIMREQDKTATIFDIQRFSIHDGPGIRTLVFFKGCSFKCQWCQNPESLSRKQEIAFYSDRCIGCETCAKVCPISAICLDSRDRIDYEKCEICDKCSTECPADALRLIGKQYSPVELVDVCLDDIEFYQSSGGGVTLSGGEPILHYKFLKAFLPEIKKHGIHCLIETAGNYTFDLLKPLLPHIDCIYYDYKLPDNQSYMTYTCSGNKRVLENMGKLRDIKFPFIVRITAVPGVNTRGEQISQICQTLSSFGIGEVILLKYNKLWEAKISRLNIKQSQFFYTKEEPDYQHIKEEYQKHDIKTFFPEELADMTSIVDIS